MRAVALLISLSVTLGACFPKDPKAQNYAKLIEGGLVVGGIGMMYFVNTGADCDAMGTVGEPDSNCHSRATIVGDIGLGLILTGLIGFIATISSSEDDKKTETVIAPVPASAKPAPKPKATPDPATPGS